MVNESFFMLSILGILIVLLFSELYTGLYGIVTKKVDPLPFSDSKEIFPPNNSVFSLTIDNPSP